MRNILFILSICFSTLACSQDQALKEAAMRDANYLNTSYVKEDVSALIKYTHPEVIKALGGKETIASMLKQTFDNAKNSNIKVVKNTTGKMLDFKKEGSEYRCLITKTTVTEVPDRKQRIIQETTMFGCYNPTLKIWQFIDGNKLANGKHKNYFNDFKTTIAIPEMKMRVEEM